MRSFLSSCLAAALVVGISIAATPARAQAVGIAPACVEGMLSSGGCANPNLALGARDRAIIFAQPRLSMTAVVRTLPSGPTANDRLFRSPNNPITDADRELDLQLGRARP